MDPLTRCARIPVDLTMSGGSEAMKMFHVSVCCAPESCPPRGRLRAVQGCAPGLEEEASRTRRTAFAALRAEGKVGSR